MSKEIAIGVDIGGSHISCAAYDLKKRRFLEDTFAESDLDNHASADEIVSVWGDTIKKTMLLAGTQHVDGIGFAMPGPFDYEKGISLFTGQNEKYENTYGLNVPDALRSYLGLPDDFKVRFINDATAFAIGEDRMGQAREVSNSLSITLGTGFGSAFIKDGLPVLEGEAVPKLGCLWHLPFEDGIADDYFSTRGFLNRYEKATGTVLPGVKQLAELAETDKLAKSLFDDFGLKLGRFLKPWIERFGIEMLVIGGNISHAYALFEQPLNDFLNEEGLSMKISISELKETASFIGSAILVDDSFYTEVKPLLKNM
ncbi:MAG: ROK family protein [Cytophagales bacterium]|nr:ROK family protein [Cytophagales bacterium]